MNFLSNFLNYFRNVSCSSTSYLWFVLDYIIKMAWDCCLFCVEPKRWRTERKSIIQRESRQREEENWRNSQENYILLHQLAKQDLFSVEKFSCDNNEQTIFKIFKTNSASTMIIAPQTINRNWRYLWRKEREMMIRRKKLKQISNQKEAILKRYHRSFWDSISVCSVE